MSGQHEQVATGLWVIGPHRLERQATPLHALGAGMNRVRTIFSGISRGTERLVLEGRVPQIEYERMRAPRQRGTFPFPVLYGYAAIGRVEAGPLKGETVFCLNPHEDLFDAPSDWLVPVPASVPAKRAVLAANMETALNAVWDSGASAGDRIAIIGGGVVGGLIAALCAQLPGADVTLIDPLPSRVHLARLVGCQWQASGEGLHECDVVFHTSAHESGLATAIAVAGFEARIVELSWYGAGSIPAPLGGAFHSQRLTLQSSQVGHVASSRRPRWTHRRRMEKALSLLSDARFDAFITHEIPFADAATQLPPLLARDCDALMPVLTYGD
jgi:hypothetical protein